MSVAWAKEARSVFMRRTLAAFGQIQRAASERRWKSGRAAGKVRRPAQPVHFDLDQMRDRVLAEFTSRDATLIAKGCRYCGAVVSIYDFSTDHIVPIKRGGAHTLDNLAFDVCADCNTAKGIMTGHEFELFRTQLLRAFPRGVVDYVLRSLRVAEVQRQSFFRGGAKRNAAPAAAESQDPNW